MNLREIGRPLLWFLIGLAVAAVPLFLLHRDQQSETVVRSYSVAPEIAREMKGALSEALSARTKDGVPIGNVSQTPDGQILVTAPESVQKGVQQILAEVAAKKLPSTPTIHFEFWLVSATATAGAGSNEPDPGLAEISSALGDIQRSKGALHFELVENLALQARAGDNNSEVQGARVSLQVNPSIRYDEKGEPVIAAFINVRTAPRPGIAFSNNSLRALTELRPGQLLVVGQGTMPGYEPTERVGQVYYIVRATL